MTTFIEWLRSRLFSSTKCKSCRWDYDGQGGMACVYCAGIGGNPEFSDKEVTK